MNSKTPRSDALLMNLKVTPEYTKEKDTDRDRALNLCRRLEVENKMLLDALVKAAGYLASVRTDRKLIRDGDEYALQTMDWANGALEYAEAANAALETYDAAESANVEASEPPTRDVNRDSGTGCAHGGSLR